MLTRPISFVLVRLLSLLLVATIGLHASEPVSSVHRTSGSAFSVATYDVALKPQRRFNEVRAAVIPQPPMPDVVRSLASLAESGRALPAPRPDSTGPPPARMVLARGPSPRAPPGL